MAAITIQDVPRLQHEGPILRDGWICTIICGKSGCGKTSLLIDIIQKTSPAVKIIVIATRVHNNPVHLAIQQWCKAEKRKCVISDDPLGIEQGVHRLQREGFLQPGISEMLLIFDDFAIHNKSPQMFQRVVVNAFTRWRNMGVNVIIVCQDITMVDPMCRNCANIKILFGSGSKSKIDSFLKDVRSSAPDEAVLNELTHYVNNTPFAYLLVRDAPFDVSVGRGPRGATKVSTVMTIDDVIVPSYREVMKELHVNSPGAMQSTTTEIQKEMGNTAHELSDSE